MFQLSIVGILTYQFGFPDIHKLDILNDTLSFTKCSYEIVDGKIQTWGNTCDFTINSLDSNKLNANFFYYDNRSSYYEYQFSKIDSPGEWVTYNSFQQHIIKMDSIFKQSELKKE